MRLQVHHRCAESDSYRAARVKSLFNCESGAEFRLEADLPLEDRDWQIGVIVGPSGSGKTSLGKAIFGPEALVDLRAGWPERMPIIDAIAPGADFDAVPAALTAVGLGTVPTWLRPFSVLSNGEQFRAGLARLLCDAPPVAVVDEWTSVIDRQVAKVGSLAFAKAWRRTKGKAVLLSCHRDVLGWLQPDWVFDTATGRFVGRCLWRRPKIDLQLWETNWRHWPAFEPHHYLKLPRMVCATNYVGTVDGELVCHLAVAPKFESGYVRASRMVVMPEWQGCGVGMRFLNAVCERHLQGQNRWQRKVMTLFHTTHPGLAAALRRDEKWQQLTARLCGDDKARCQATMRKSAERSGATVGLSPNAGYGGHFRAVQGFRYIGKGELL